jgi:hypothetical protein
MAMSFDEMRGLFRKIMQFDGRDLGTPDQARDVINTWCGVAASQHWTPDIATLAVEAWYARTKRWIAPADITDYVRKSRERDDQDQWKSQTTPATDEVRRQCMADIRRTLKARPPTDPGALLVYCPHCRSAPGEQCTEPATGRRLRRTHEARGGISHG